MEVIIYAYSDEDEQILKKAVVEKHSGQSIVTRLADIQSPGPFTVNSDDFYMAGMYCYLSTAFHLKPSKVQAICMDLIRSLTGDYKT